MQDQAISKKQFINELVQLRQQNAELEKSGIKHKQAGEALREAKDRLHSLFEGIPVGLYRSTPEGQRLDANQALLQLVKCPNREAFLKGNIIDVYVNPDDRKKWQAQMELKGVVRGFEAQCRRQDGTVFWMRDSARIVRDSEGQILYYEGAVEDITERKQTEEELKKYREHLEEMVEKRTTELKAANERLQQEIIERKRAEEVIKSSEERLRILFEYAPDGYYLSDSNGTFIDGNKAAEELIGYKKEELIGKSFLKLRLLSPAQILKAAKLLAKNVRGRPTGPDEFILNRKDGKQVAVEIRTYPVKTKDQKLVLGIAHDITKRKRAEQALIESKSKLQEQKLALEQKNIALGEVIAQIEVEKRRIKDDIETNVNIVVSPILEKLKKEKASAKYVTMLKYHLGRLTSSFGSKMTKKSFKLTPREIEVCNLVKGGLTSKDISNLLNISYRTIEKHRKNIRHKLGISNKRINLTSFLREL